MDGDLSDAAKADAGQARAALAPLSMPWAVSTNVQIEFLNSRSIEPLNDHETNA